MAPGGGADPAGERLDVMTRGWCLGATQESCDDRRRWCSEMGEEEVVQLLPGGDRGRRQVEEPRVRDAGEGHG